jgi:hypothetical protein
MRSGRYSRLAGLIAFFWCAVAFGQALPAYTGNINANVAGVVTQKIVNRGFAANDPRIASTLNSMGNVGKQAVGVAANDARYVSSARSVGRIFMKFAGPLAVLSLASDMVFTDVDQDKAQLSGAALNGSVIKDLSSGMSVGGAYWSSSGVSGSDPKSVAWQAFTVSPPWTTWTFTEYTPGSWTSIRQIYYGTRYHPSYCAAGGCQGTAVYVDYHATGAPKTCVAGTYYSGGACVGYSYGLQNAPTYTPTPKTVEELVPDIPPTKLTQPLPDQAIADLTNQWWDAASAADPNALPRAQTDPVTPADVASWRTANPAQSPKVQDWFSPAVPNTTSAQVPLPQPATAPTPSPNPTPNPQTPGQGTQVDLGPDPNTPPPSLEATPTIQSIVGPITSLMPDLRNFNVADQAGTCPQSSFTVFNRTHTLSSHCDLINNNRAVIEAAMLAVWTICAMFIVLRA